MNNHQFQLFRRQRVENEERQVSELIQKIWRMASEERPNSNKSLFISIPRHFWSNSSVMDLLEREAQKAGVTIM